MTLALLNFGTKSLSHLVASIDRYVSVFSSLVQDADDRVVIYKNTYTYTKYTYILKNSFHVFFFVFLFCFSLFGIKAEVVLLLPLAIILFFYC